MAAIDYHRSLSLTAVFYQQAERHAELPFLWRRQDKKWDALTWRTVAEQVTRLAGGLVALGLQPGARVLLVSENRPEWLIADMAIMAAGGVTVPGYITNLPGDHLHLINNAQVSHAIVSTRALTERVVGAASAASHPPKVITIDPPAFRQNPGVEIHHWDTVLALGSAQDGEIAARIAAVTRSDTACIIYTSGTGGAPKGVMLSHGAILCNCLGAHDLVASLGLQDEIFLSFLPLSHAYEHTAGQFFPITIGAQIYYAEGVEHLSANMAEVGPTLMVAVPRLYEMMRARILANVERQGGLSARLFHRAVALGARRYEEPDSLSLFERLQNRVLDRLVRSKVADRFGGHLKALVSGGGPLNYDVGLFFTALGIRILQGYGQTEAAPVVSCNQPNKVKLRTVGPPLTGVTIRIADDGEILLRGELLMQGYWDDEEATRKTLVDGWLHTGDIGQIDGDGYLQITDRKKDIIVNSGGDNISPQRVEGFLTLQPDIAQAMVIGDRRPNLVALLVPDADRAAVWAAAHGKPTSLADLIDDPDFRRHIGDCVDKVNKTLSLIERVRRFALIAEPFSVANEEMTPTLKIRRHVIGARYRDILDRLYG